MACRPAEILHTDGAVLIAGDGDQIAVTLARLVDGIGKDLKNRVLAAVQPVGAEDDGRALADAVGAFKQDDALVAVLFCLTFGHAVIFLTLHEILYDKADINLSMWHTVFHDKLQAAAEQSTAV